MAKRQQHTIVAIIGAQDNPTQRSGGSATAGVPVVNQGFAAVPVLVGERPARLCYDRGQGLTNRLLDSAGVPSVER